MRRREKTAHLTTYYKHEVAVNPCILDIGATLAAAAAAAASYNCNKHDARHV